MISQSLQGQQRYFHAAVQAVSDSVAMAAVIKLIDLD